ncbi:MAG: histidine kinase, partial [Bacteroidetes bacterium]
MISRSLAARTADFLKNYPPFSFVDMGDLEALAASISLRYYAEGELVFEAESPAQEQFFVLHKGRVELLQPEKQGYRLIDVCDEGESFGLRAMLGRRPYLTRALVAEDALVYLVPG